MNFRSDAQRLKKEKERKEKELEHYGYNDENIEESSHTRSLVRLFIGFAYVQPIYFDYEVILLYILHSLNT